MGKRQRAKEPAQELGPLERLRAETAQADRVIRWVTWGCTAGMVLWSMLTATPYVAAHVTDGWQKTAPVLPLVVDAAFVGALYADEVASRHGISGGAWALMLRLFTGAASVFLNIGHAVETGDGTGVGQHLIAPGVLVLLAECGPVYRRRLVNRLTAAEEKERRDQERQRVRDQQEADQQRRQEQQDEDRRRAQAQEDQDRLRKQRQE
ncbi:hypothetical protein ACFW1M_43885, partial [Streptomyces inhibens]